MNSSCKRWPTSSALLKRIVPVLIRAHGMNSSAHSSASNLSASDPPTSFSSSWSSTNSALPKREITSLCQSLHNSNCDFIAHDPCTPGGTNTGSPPKIFKKVIHNLNRGKACD